MYIFISGCFVIYDSLNVYRAISHRNEATLHRVAMDKFAYTPRVSLYGGIVFLKTYSIYEYSYGDKKYKTIV